METTIKLTPEQTKLLHDLCSYADAKDYDEKLHLIGVDASVSATGSEGEAIGEFFNIKKMMVSFLGSVENDIRKLKTSWVWRYSY